MIVMTEKDRDFISRDHKRHICRALEIKNTPKIMSYADTTNLSPGIRVLMDLFISKALCFFVYKDSVTIYVEAYLLPDSSKLVKVTDDEVEFYYYTGTVDQFQKLLARA